MDREPPSFKIGDRVNIKKDNQGNGTSNGDLDTGLSILSMTDITYTLKIKLLEKQSHATSRMKYLNHQWNSGTLTHNLTKLEDTPTTLQICQLSHSMTDDEHLTDVHSHLWITCTHLLSSILCMITLVNTGATQESWEWVLFHPVLKAYPTCHSWTLKLKYLLLVKYVVYIHQTSLTIVNVHKCSYSYNKSLCYSSYKISINNS